MNTKILIQTLTEVPDLQLLNQLLAILKKTNSLVIPDVRKLFQMISNLYNCKDPSILSKVFELNQYINKIMLNTEVQVEWGYVGRSLIKLCGEENAQTRKRARQIVLGMMQKTNNSYMILQKLYYEGLQDESTIVMIYAMKLIFAILELTPTLLIKKSSISIVKLILEKIIRLTNSQHSDLQKNALEFLDKLFFLKIQRMDEVLQRLEEFYMKSLQTIWERNKENLLYSSKQEGSEQAKVLKQIKYQHLPIINDKIFGVYQPFIIKNLFNYQTHAARKYSLTQFKSLFEQNEERLTKYINSICKIISKLLPERDLEVAELLNKILSLPGITNIINVNEVGQKMIDQLQTQNVMLRRQLKEGLKKFAYMGTAAQAIIKKYQQALEDQTQNQLKIENWLKTYELLCLIEHWIQTAPVHLCYPPTLNFLVKHISLSIKKKHPILKVHEQSEKMLIFVFEKFAGYKELLEEYFDQKTVGEFEDILENRRIQKIKETQKELDAKETFLKEFSEERLRFLKNKKQKK